MTLSQSLRVFVYMVAFLLSLSNARLVNAHDLKGSLCLIAEACAASAG